ncbi:restriction endonuclease [Candidatus Leptofilum sp.]|uniref:restriction endonuclease n=1 Tax=Candidatus Leptofilum sp. TaxID=3241576 RepID=UPI003B5AC486
MREHEFTLVIQYILTEHFSESSDLILERSDLLQYINTKTVSASRGSKARGSFGNLYAIYVLVEDYLNRNFDESGDYREAEGAKFTDLFQRQRELPFGSKLQNHALNHRLNQEFEKYFPISEYVPIIRDTQTSEYWFNENLLLIDTPNGLVNIGQPVIEIIDAYVEAKQGAFNAFIEDCERMQTVSQENPSEVAEFLLSLLRPNVDARIFEIVSFAILKNHYSDFSIYWGWSPNDIEEETLVLYKTGRTNANDGGIDFVMRPLGRFFQVTETLDVKKHFLDIDKIQKFPVTFVIKSELPIEEIQQALRIQAEAQFPVRRVIEKYMASIEEIINIPILSSFLDKAISENTLEEILSEMIIHSKVEFNIHE